MSDDAAKAGAPIPYGRQDIREEDIAAVVEVLRSDFLTQGPWVPRFEAAVAEAAASAHAVAVTSATAALHLACIALDLGPGKRLWTSAITFVASANCARYCGAAVDFVDIDPRTYNLCPVALEAKLDHAERDGSLPDVVVPVHLTGQSCDMEAIGRLAERYGFRVLEDASHAIGGRWNGAPIGDCAHSDAAVFSFHPVKIVTTGEGGAIVTQDPELAERVSRLRTHGITRDEHLMKRVSDGPWYYEQIELGYNYRLTDLQAALGVRQLDRLGAYVDRRNALAERYNRLLSGLPVVTPWQDPRGRSARHLYVIRLAEGASPDAHLRVFQGLRDAGIGVNLHYMPVPLHPDYAALGHEAEAFPHAMAYYRSAISLPLFPTLTHAAQDRVVTVLTRMLRNEADRA